MILIYEQLSYHIVFKIVLDKFFSKKKNQYFFLEKNKSIILNYFINNIFLVKYLKWDILSLNSNDNTCIFNNIEKKILHKTIIKILKLDKKNINNNYYFDFLKYRFLSHFKLSGSNKSLLNYLIIFYAINNIFNKQNNDKIYLYLYRFNCFNELINCAHELNIKINFIYKLDVDLKIFIKVKLIIKNIIYKTKSFFLFNSINNFFHIDYKEKIIVDLPLQMNNPNHFFNHEIKKDFFLLVNRCIILTSNEYKKIIDSNISFYEFGDKNFSNNFSHILSVNNYKKKNKLIKKYLSSEKKIWKNFFQKNNSFVYYFNGLGYEHSIAACSAIDDLDGVSVSSQTSFHDDSTVASCADIFFTFSSNPGNILINQISKTKYIIQAGYVHDYNFKIKKKLSIDIRNNLLKKGVKKIIAFFDQGHLEEATYEYGYYNSSTDYEFILNKLIENSWMGLIIKPKKPTLLKFKLKRIEDLFSKALSTGRLHINLDSSDTNNTKDFDNPPCVSSMASDFAIHVTPSLVCTAGIESYLSSKTPTIFLDKMKFVNNEIKNNNHSLIVFNNWSVLWDSVYNFLFFNKNKHSLGNLSEFSNKVDIFNDGKASFRVLNFLQDLNDNRSIGNKNYIIEYAVNKYADKWGKEKIFKI